MKGGIQTSYLSSTSGFTDSSSFTVGGQVCNMTIRSRHSVREGVGGAGVRVCPYHLMGVGGGGVRVCPNR